MVKLESTTRRAICISFIDDKEFDDWLKFIMIFTGDMFDD
jgi:hypothetical protein